MENYLATHRQDSRGYGEGTVFPFKTFCFTKFNRQFKNFSQCFHILMLYFSSSESGFGCAVFITMICNSPTLRADFLSSLTKVFILTLLHEFMYYCIPFSSFGVFTLSIGFLAKQNCIKVFIRVFRYLL